MKTAARSSIVWMIGILFLLGMSPAHGAAGAPAVMQEAKMPFAPGELLVKFKDVALPPGAAADATTQETMLRTALPRSAVDALGRLQAQTLPIMAVPGLAHVKYSANVSVQDAARELLKSGAVEYAEPNYRVRLNKVEPPADPALGSTPYLRGATPTDPRFAEQWALNNTGQTGGEANADIDAVEAWNVATDSSKTIVAVLSTGINYNHPYFKANLWKNPGEVCGDGIDNDSNGYVDDCYGIDAYLNSGDPIDENGRGTHMAGIVGAVGSNGIGIAGVGWKAQLMALKFLDEEGWGWVGDAVQCISYALTIKDKNAYPRMVILSSVVGSSYSKAFYDVVNTARVKGVLFVAGSGDANQDVRLWPIYPGGYTLDNIIKVSPSTPADYRVAAGYGVYLSGVDLAAPGQSILSTWLTTTYRLDTNSDCGAAHVAGAAALVWAKNDTMNWKQVKGLILNGAEDGLHWAFYNGYNNTEGRLNLKNSLTAAYNDDPAVFSIIPPITMPNELITINGINFGTTAKTITFKEYSFPSTSIVSWTNEKITARIPADCTTGYGRLTVTTDAGTSRGSFFQTGPNEWVYPSWMGTTLLQHEEAAFAQVGSDVWIFSGNSEYGQTESVERFSLLTMRGEVRPEWEIPKAVRRAGAAAIGTKIYVVGGYDEWTGKYQSALQIFDTTTGTWTRGRNLPRVLDMPSVVSLSGKLYVMGGRDPNNSGLKACYMYNPSTNIWTTRAALPLKTAYAMPVSPAANKIWLLSGITENGGSWSRTRNVLEYDTVANTWDIRDDISLNGEHAAGGATVIGTGTEAKIYCLYGDSDWSAGEWFRTGKWVRDITYLNGLGTYTPMVGKLNNLIYVISGSKTRNVYRITPP